jgi:glycosyltransferase involved in cell wall biosynthesis
MACLYQPDRLRLTAELRQIRPDVIEAFGTEGPYAYAAVSSGLPCVVYIQGIITEILKTMDVAPANPQWIHHFLTQFFERWTIRRGKYYIVENEFGARFVKQLNPDSKSFVLPNIINPLFFQTQSAPADQKPEILFVGRLSILKGCLELIRAFEVIRAARPETRLTLIGDVSPEVMRTIQLLPLHVQESINICGRQDQPFIMNKMQAKPIFVCPSRMDSSPNSVYEAMAAGLPVVATRAGGLPYMIESGTTGYITDPLDPDSLAERILYLLDHPDERRRLGANASRVTRERLSSQKIVQELINIYRQVCAQQ